jgi:hypothetical protein
MQCEIPVRIHDRREGVKGGQPLATLLVVIQVCIVPMTIDIMRKTAYPWVSKRKIRSHLSHSLFAILAGLFNPSIAWLRRFTYRASSSSPIPSSFTRRRDKGAKIWLVTDVIVVSPSFMPTVARRMTGSVTSSLRDLMN